MRQTIVQTLERIEAEHHVRILFAVESGSRAWGFASPDSDYDVRYIYIRRREDYLRIDPPRDTIEGPLDEILDFSGWDLRKALLLLRKTNPSLLEWTHSPIVYRTTPVWEAMAADFPAFFSRKKNMLHYLSMASSDWDTMIAAEQVKLKRYLYSLRTLLCCRWLAVRASSPPIEFDVLCREMLPEALEADVREVLRRKKLADEKGLSPHFPELDAFISSEILRLKAVTAELPGEEPGDLQKLNRMFFQALKDTQGDFPKT